LSPVCFLNELWLWRLSGKRQKLFYL